MTKLKRHNIRGFTIVELLIVIVVISVLAVITIVAYNGVQHRARSSLAVSSLNNVTKKLEVYNVEFGAYPGSLNTVNVSDTSSVSYQYRIDSSVGYCVTATASNVSMYATALAKHATPGACAGHGVNGVQAVTNFVINPSFEINSTGWGSVDRNGYSGTISTAQKLNGNSSFAFTAPSIGSAATDTYLEANTPVSEPGTYYLSANVYLTSNGATYLNRDSFLHCTSGGCNGGTTPAYNRSNLNAWQRLQSTVTISGPGVIRTRFYAPLGGTIYIDNVMVSRGQSNYADGTSTNWIWNGAPHASTSTGPAL